MKNNFPPNVVFSNRLREIAPLLPQDQGAPSLTDIQYDALAAGVNKGTSILVSAPTSTGKTLIGWWAVTSTVEAGGRAVYLVSHRTLAKQKAEEARRLFVDTLFDGDQSAIVCATGDSVEDVSGRKTSAPLDAMILVATYEKFLGCISVGGPPRDLTDTTFICDEVQLVGDQHRGQNVELLLTLMRRAGWKQLVGLSAVISEQDTQELADWLGLIPVRNSTREKSLRLQCRAVGAIDELIVGPNLDGEFTEEGRDENRDIDQIVAELIQNPEQSPVIVFCMKVDDTYRLSGEWAAHNPPILDVQMTDGLEIGDDVLRALRSRSAFHNAELGEDERALIEQRLAEGLIDVVYSTSTLAAGVNFPLGSAVFSSFKRWNGDRKHYESISRAEFHNMAGRVGRMGQVAEEGLVILTADNVGERRQARSIMDFRLQDELGAGISPQDFGALTLQLFAGKLCATREDAFELISSTLSASRIATRERGNVDHWRDPLEVHIDRLTAAGCLIETLGVISVSTFGLAVARSGLKPETAMFFIDHLLRKAAQLSELLPFEDDEGREDDFLFVLAHAALLSPEYGTDGGKATRYVNWRVGRPNLVQNPFADRLGDMLIERQLGGNPGAANGALLVASWASGMPRVDVENLVSGVRLGTVQSLARDAAWILSGISDIISEVTSPTIADELRPLSLRQNPDLNSSIRQLVRSLRRQSTRINAGLPSDVLWMTGMELPGPRRRLSRAQILSLRAAMLTRPLDLMNGDPVFDQRRRAALGGIENPAVANRVRAAATSWKVQDRTYTRQIHNRRAVTVGAIDIIGNLYDNRGDELEGAFSSAMEFIGFQVEALDLPGRQAYPDFRISLNDLPPIVVEVKSKVSDTDLVGLNSSTEVLAASELIGMAGNFCITLCNPGVQPNVPSLIERCGRLCVIEVSDLAEALLRLCEGRLSLDGFYNWLTTPGVALSEDLPSPI